MSGYTEGLNAQVLEQKRHKAQQALYEKAENLRHMAHAGAGQDGFVAELLEPGGVELRKRVYHVVR